MECLLESFIFKKPHTEVPKCLAKLSNRPSKYYNSVFEDVFSEVFFDYLKNSFFIKLLAFFFLYFATALQFVKSLSDLHLSNTHTHTQTHKHTHTHLSFSLSRSTFHCALFLLNASPSYRINPHCYKIDVLLHQPFL